MMFVAVENTTVPSWAFPAFLIGTLFQFIFNAIVAVALQRSRQVKDDLTSLRTKLHETAEKLIDERFRAMSHSLNNHVQQFVATLDDMKERLQDGDENFDSITERNQKIELAAVARISDLKEFMRETFCTKSDQCHHNELAERRGHVMAEKLEEIGKDVAVLKNQQQPGKRNNG
jgi:paraquat-inducible protein B